MCRTNASPYAQQPSIKILYMYMYVCTYIFQCRELLQLLGLPCLQSDGEADVLCALLSSNGVSIIVFKKTLMFPLILHILSLHFSA